MTEQEIREELQSIQKIWYTPTSKIGADIGMAGSYVGRFINEKFQENESASQRLLEELENWIIEKKKIFKNSHL